MDRLANAGGKLQECPPPTPASPFISLFPLTLLKRGSRKNFRPGPQLTRGEAVQLMETASLSLVGQLHYICATPRFLTAQQRSILGYIVVKMFYSY